MENIVGNGENAGYQHLFLIPQCFPKPSIKEVLEVGIVWKRVYPFPKRQFLDRSKLKEFAEDNFKFDENGRMLSKRVENTAGK